MRIITEEEWVISQGITNYVYCIILSSVCGAVTPLFQKLFETYAEYGITAYMTCCPNWHTLPSPCSSITELLACPRAECYLFIIIQIVDEMKMYANSATWMISICHNQWQVVILFLHINDGHGSLPMDHVSILLLKGMKDLIWITVVL